MFGSNSKAVSSGGFVRQMVSAFGVRCGLHGGDMCPVESLDSAGSNH